MKFESHAQKCGFAISIYIFQIPFQYSNDPKTFASSLYKWHAALLQAWVARSYFVLYSGSQHQKRAAGFSCRDETYKFKGSNCDAGNMSRILFAIAHTAELPDSSLHLSFACAATLHTNCSWETSRNRKSVSIITFRRYKLHDDGWSQALRDRLNLFY